MAEPSNISVPITFKVRDPCINPVMLLWLNSTGGFSQWMFERKQAVNIEVERGGIYENFFFDIETTNRVLQQRTSSYSHAWDLQADDLTKNELLALFELKSTEQVYVLRQDGETIGVIAEGLTTLYERFSKRHKFNVKVNWPIDFNPEKWFDDE